ncbi:Hypothetical protein OINT_2000440 [Brucella intermedia LMG 3301]|uniref:Uncharacterized protein n=1 Tax=Brucella intermedia LMG 3301 TaxID=641118 RepID=C4WMY6_9HYPH|nr:Hypothetical protein OINT_2000440 [Brucella intermedia LMG 3301]
MFETVVRRMAATVVRTGEAARLEIQPCSFFGLKHDLL